MKSFSALLLGALFIGTTYFTGIGKQLADFCTPRMETTAAATPFQEPAPPPSGASANTVDDVVTKALYFKSLLTTTQQNTLQQTYTATLARKWSNLPCGSGCRNGIQFSALTPAQLGAALEVVKAALSTGYSNQGANEFYQIRLADWVLSHQYSGGSGYDSTIYFMAFLNTPTATGQWMLQFGGHHYAANIGFNGGKVVGPTPQFRGVEPTSFTVSGTTYTPLSEERTALQAMLASFSSSELATAKIATTFSDVLLSPGESNGNSNTFPATKQGIAVSTLNSTKQALVLAAMEPYIQDLDDASAAILRTQYAKEINGTYVCYSKNTGGTSGTAGSFLTTNTDYVRIDGPGVWIEFICQTGVVIQSQIHYHTVYRDHLRDYGADLTLTTLPVNITSFGVNVQGGSRLVNWKTADESAVDRYEVERSNNPSGGFVFIGQVAARNTDRYSFTDNEALTDKIVYYRLKVVNRNGQTTYGNVVAVKLNKSGVAVSVYPNPAKDKLTVLLGKDAVNASLKVIGNNGAVVYAKTGLSGSRFTVDAAGFAAGAYIVRVEEEGTAATANFIKK